MNKINKLVLDPSCHQQFIPCKSGQIPCDKDDFLKRVNELYEKTELQNGYAHFCKHLFIENFTDANQSVVEITEQNKKFVRTIYEARTEKELPVLTRYYPKELVKPEKAMFLDLILYSKGQIQKQNQAMGNVDPNKDVDYDYGIIWVKLQNLPSETPMDPITMMRNALGKQEGGSGVNLEREKYLESVSYWTKFAIIK